MVRVLRDNVAVAGRWYRRGQSEADVGDDAARIGDHAWVESGVASAAPAPPASVPTPVDVVEDEALESAPEREAADALTPPPRYGKGSSEEAWRDYAEALGVDVSGAASRGDVIAAVDGARESS